MKNSVVFKTTEEEKQNIPNIINEMIACGLDKCFVYAAAEIADYCQGSYDLMNFWLEHDGEERAAVEDDIEEMLFDYLKAPNQDHCNDFASKFIACGEDDGLGNDIFCSSLCHYKSKFFAHKHKSTQIEHVILRVLRKCGQMEWKELFNEATKKAYFEFTHDEFCGVIIDSEKLTTEVGAHAATIVKKEIK